MSTTTVRLGTPAPVVPAVGHGTGFWLVAAVFLTTMAFSTVPAPLYPLYQEADEFSTLTVSVVFAAYAVGVVVSLLLAGHVSDRVGRRAVLLPALGLELVAAVLFLSGSALPLLLVARFVSGLGVGALTATATAHLQDLHARHRPGAPDHRLHAVSTVANLGGLGVGSLVAGLLAQTGVAPLRLSYAVFAVLLAGAVVAVLRTPETVERGPRAAAHPPYRPQRPRVPAGPARRPSLVALAGAAASFAVFGVFTSVAPGFVAGTLHHPARALAGLVVFVVFGSAAAAQVLGRRVRTDRRLRAGAAAEAAGLVLLVAGMAAASLPLFLVGGAVTGAGAGLLFAAAVATVSGAAEPARRGEALAGLFLVAYLGLSVPALALGLLTLRVPATAAMAALAGTLVVVLAAVALAGRPGGRASSRAGEG
ncbi:MFS transporter [Cellulomonas sp. ES6]|uniref:MFS transporter n=1 Tax=Cellulomonas sp. ES6 TaxID=3039384 RepID=UPI0024B72AA0|nr:MFS transporter [Cellulomonas sp. ES6]WHP19285.1 MFS transporter [Cellulomonas sp. ES6]